MRRYRKHVQTTGKYFKSYDQHVEEEYNYHPMHDVHKELVQYLMQEWRASTGKEKLFKDRKPIYMYGDKGLGAGIIFDFQMVPGMQHSRGEEWLKRNVESFCKKKGLMYDMVPSPKQELISVQLYRPEQRGEVLAKQVGIAEKYSGKGVVTSQKYRDGKWVDTHSEGNPIVESVVGALSEVFDPKTVRVFLRGNYPNHYTVTAYVNESYANDNHIADCMFSFYYPANEALYCIPFEITVTKNGVYENLEITPENVSKFVSEKIHESRGKLLGHKIGITESEAEDGLRYEVDLFVKQYSGKEGEEEWGESLAELRTERGVCSMVSHTLCEFLRSDGFECKPITMELRKYRDEDWGQDGTHHTAVLVDNETVVDLTFGQFDPSEQFPLIVSIEKWKSML